MSFSAFQASSLQTQVSSEATWLMHIESMTVPGKGQQTLPGLHLLASLVIFLSVAHPSCSRRRLWLLLCFRHSFVFSLLLNFGHEPLLRIYLKHH